MNTWYKIITFILDHKQTIIILFLTTSRFPSTHHSNRPTLQIQRWIQNYENINIVWQWTLPMKQYTTNDCFFPWHNKWLPQKNLSWTTEKSINHNILLLTLINNNTTISTYYRLTSITNRDTTYITSPHTIPLCYIHINECNPENDIAHTQTTFYIEHNIAHIYNDIG